MVSNGFVDPYETVLIDQKRAGEMLVSQLRILGLLLVVPPSLIRIFGYGIFDYLPFGVVQWGVFMLYSLGVYLLLKRGAFTRMAPLVPRKIKTAAFPHVR